MSDALTFDVNTGAAIAKRDEEIADLRATVRKRDEEISDQRATVRTLYQEREKREQYIKEMELDLSLADAIIDSVRAEPTHG